jgi:hypothetical protein
VFSVLLSIFLDEKFAIDVAFLEAVKISMTDLGNINSTDMAPSSPPKSLTQKAWVYNDGTGDIGDTPSQFLLVRNLDTLLQEETIANGLTKLEAEPKRVLLIRDRKTNVSWGFAFIEYQDVSVCSLVFVIDSSTHERHSRNTRLTKPLKSKNQRLKSLIVILGCLFQSTQIQVNTLLQRQAEPLSHTGTRTPTRQNGVNQEKKVHVLSRSVSYSRVERRRNDEIL